MSAGHVRHKSEADGTSPEDRQDVLETLAQVHARSLIRKATFAGIERRCGMERHKVENALAYLRNADLVVDDRQAEYGARRIWLTAAGWEAVGGKLKWGVFT